MRGKTREEAEMAPSERVSIYVGEALQRLMAERPENKGLWSRSGLINTVASRYMDACERHRPTLHWREWAAIFDALNGCWLQSDSQFTANLLTSLWAEVYDADRLDGLGPKWEIDAKGLAEKIREMDYATTMAIVDAAERWWARDHENDEELEESIKAVVGAEHLREP
jgi:hypothetical protein